MSLGGVCIDMMSRCDNINDCADKSDEADCSRVRENQNWKVFYLIITLGQHWAHIPEVHCTTTHTFSWEGSHQYQPFPQKDNGYQVKLIIKKALSATLSNSFI